MEISRIGLESEKNTEEDFLYDDLDEQTLLEIDNDIASSQEEQDEESCFECRFKTRARQKTGTSGKRNQTGNSRKDRQQRRR